MYIKTGNILGFQFVLVPLPPSQNALFIGDSGWKGNEIKLYYNIKQNPHGFSTALLS